MSHARVRIALLASMLAVLSACPQPDSVPAGSPSEERQISEVSNLVEISWVGPEALVIRGDHARRDWIMRRSDGHTIRLDSFSTEDWTQSSPDGTELLTLGTLDETLDLVDVRAALEDRLAVDRIAIPPFPEMDTEVSKQNRTFAFWLNDGRALVTRTNPELDYTRCYLYVRKTRELQAAPHCIDGAWLGPTWKPGAIVALGDDRYGIYTGDEGSTHLSVIRFRPESGASGIGEQITYPRIGAPDVYRDASADTLYLASLVRLDPDGSHAERLEDVAPPGPATLYRLTPGSGFQPTDRTLPHRGTLRSIESGDIAWIEAERAQLCTSAPGQMPLCHALPPEVDPGAK